MTDLSPFDALDAAFRDLGSGPAALTVNGSAIGGGLPPRVLTLVELRTRFFHHKTTGLARNDVMRRVVSKAQAGSDAWRVAVVGLALPVLRRVSAYFRPGCPQMAEDTEAEVITGALAELAALDVRGPDLLRQLVQGAIRHARRRAAAEVAYATRTESLAESCRPTLPFGHPDFVLDHAVTEGVISAHEAVLIGDTRLGGTPIAALAAELDVSYNSAQLSRRRAEQRLVAWLTGK